MNRILIASALLAGTISVASAADVYTPDSLKDTFQERSPISWTAFWVAGAGGYQFANYEGDLHVWDDTDTQNSPAFDKYLNIDGLGSEGLFGEVQVGFDQQINDRMFIGAFGGYNLNNGEHTITFTDTAGISTEILNISQDWGAVVGPRIGFIKDTNTAFYVAGGLAVGQLNINDAELVDDELIGWFGEVGAEHRFEGYENVRGFIAIRYTDYQAVTVAEGDVPKTNDDEFRATLDRDDIVGMMGIKLSLF
jgi:opacity protein-like surface antigen